MPASLIAEALTAGCDPLDDPIEVQAHGTVRVASDAEALVLDPPYRDTDVEALTRRLLSATIPPGARFTWS